MRRTTRYLPLANNNDADAAADDAADNNDELNHGNHCNRNDSSVTGRFPTPTTQHSFWENPQTEEKWKLSPPPQKELGKNRIVQSSDVPESVDDDDNDDGSDDFFSMFSWSAKARSQTIVQPQKEPKNDCDTKTDKEETLDAQASQHSRTIKSMDWAESVMEKNVYCLGESLRDTKPRRLLRSKSSEGSSRRSRSIDTNDISNASRCSHQNKSNKSKNNSHHSTRTFSKNDNSSNHSRLHKSPSSSSPKTQRSKKVVNPSNIDNGLTGTASLVSKSRRSKSIDPSDPLEPLERVSMSRSSRSKSLDPLEDVPGIRSLLTSIHSESKSTFSNKTLDPAFDPSFFVKTPELKRNKSVELCDRFLEEAFRIRYEIQDDTASQISQLSQLSQLSSSSRSSKLSRSKSPRPELSPRISKIVDPYTGIKSYPSTPALRTATTTTTTTTTSKPINIKGSSHIYKPVSTAPRPILSRSFSPKRDLMSPRIDKRLDPSSSRSNRSTPTTLQLAKTTTPKHAKDDNHIYESLNFSASKSRSRSVDPCDDFSSSWDPKRAHSKECHHHHRSKSSDALEDLVPYAMARKRFTRKKSTNSTRNDDERPTMMTVDLRDLMAHVMDDLDDNQHEHDTRVTPIKEARHIKSRQDNFFDVERSFDEEFATNKGNRGFERVESLPAL